MRARLPLPRSLALFCLALLCSALLYSALLCSAWLCLALLGSAWLCLALLGSAWLYESDRASGSPTHAPHLDLCSRFYNESPTHIICYITQGFVKSTGVIRRLNALFSSSQGPLSAVSESPLLSTAAKGPKLILVFDTDPRHQYITKHDFRTMLVNLIDETVVEQIQVPQQGQGAEKEVDTLKNAFGVANSTRRRSLLEVDQSSPLMSTQVMAYEVTRNFHHGLSRKALLALLAAVDGWIPWRAQRKAFRDVSLRLILEELIVHYEPFRKGAYHERRRATRKELGEATLLAAKDAISKEKHLKRVRSEAIVYVHVTSACYVLGSLALTPHPPTPNPRTGK